MATLTAEQRLQAVEDGLNTLQAILLNKIPRTEASDALLALEEEVESVKALRTEITDQQLVINDRLRKLTASFQTAQEQ